ncbi:hypothetical protein AO390_04005 [Pseudomonas marginalis ICMP 11289]|nr:hypothetical protein AO390_04005 [Pseudomonas marginalis ICMP 11289]
MGVQSKIEEKILEYLLATPKALAILAASFVSGHLWIFVIKAYRKRTKASHFVESKTGRTAVGLLWMAAVLFVIYVSRFRDLSFDYEKILIICIPTIIVSLFVQLVIFVLFLVVGDK